MALSPRQLAWLFAIALFCVVRQGQPCSPPCDLPVRLFGANVQVPGNLIYFKVLKTPHMLELRHKDGSVVPARIRELGGDQVFAPDATVPAGAELTLWYAGGCIKSPMRYEFGVTPPAELQPRPAELSVEELGTAYPGSPINESAFVRARYYPPDADGNMLHLIESTVTIDGRPFDFASEAWQVTGDTIIEVLSRCRYREPPTDGGWSIDTCGRLRTVPAGEHVLVVTPEIIGTDVAVLPVSLRIETRCPLSYAKENVPLSAAPTSLELAALPSATPASTPPPSRGCSLIGAVALAREGKVSAILMLLGSLIAGLRSRALRSSKL